MKWLMAFGLALLQLLPSPAAHAHALPSLRDVQFAISEIELERARHLLDQLPSDALGVSLEKARLAIYQGDCERALAILSNPAFAEMPEAGGMRGHAARCAGATVAAEVVEDVERKIVIRLQDSADRVLVPFLFDVAAVAKSSIAAQLGMTPPEPLRIDLVRDLFSLSAVSGLPLEAAETTGTLAVARFGRVILLSPRAPLYGYPWKDTLAHEITHLLVSRATRDHAPLWLQEGLAKHFETRWRDSLPFDHLEWADREARLALLQGRSVGIDQLGPSIAMLPTHEAATTAFAEVTSFVRFWMHNNGALALKHLLFDLKQLELGQWEDALRSVSAYSLSEWKLIWQAQLLREPVEGDPEAQAKGRLARRKAADNVELGDLLAEAGYFSAAYKKHEEALKMAPRDGSLRFRLSRDQLLLGDKDAGIATLANLSDVEAPNARWLALRGRFFEEQGRNQEANALFKWALSLSPYALEVACQGKFKEELSTLAGSMAQPADVEWYELCAFVQTLPQH